MNVEPRKPNLQRLAIDQVAVDMKNIQSRAAMSKEDEREFSESMKVNGWGSFPPVVAFFDQSKYWLADGFHRHGAAKRAGLPWVLTDVRDGDKRDAMIYSAGANLKFSIKRTAEDKRRAVEMILNDPQGFHWCDLLIREHCDVSGALVVKCRAEHCTKNNIPLPTVLQNKSGDFFPRRSKRNYTLVNKGSVNQVPSLGDPAEPERATMGITLQSLQLFFARHGISFGRHNSENAPKVGVSCLIGNGCTVSFIEPYGADSLVKAVGNVFLGASRQKDSRLIILCASRLHGDIRAVAGLLTAKYGIEFISPEELADDLVRRNKKGR